MGHSSQRNRAKAKRKNFADFASCNRRIDQAIARTTSRPDLLGGKPCIQGTRLSVDFIRELVDSGATREEIIASYPQLTNKTAVLDEIIRQSKGNHEQAP